MDRPTYPDALVALSTRHSIRKYKDVPVPIEMLGRIIQCGIDAPTSGNIQDVKFILVRSAGKRKEIAKACLQQFWMEEAPAHIIVTSEVKRARQYYGLRGERLYAVQNTAAATENMLIAAHALGLGACWVSGFDEELVKVAAGIPAYARPHSIITVGYANEDPEPPLRYKIENITYFESYGNKVLFPGVVMGEYSKVAADIVKGAAGGIDKHATKLFQKAKHAVKKLGKK